MESAHAAARSHLGNLLFEFLMNACCFIPVFDLRSALFYVFIDAVGFSQTPILLAPPTQRQIARRGAASVEVLVEPVLRRNNDGSLLPIKSLDGRSFGPHERVAFAGQNHDVRAGTV